MELVRARPPALHSAPGMRRRRQRGSNAPPSVMITPSPLMLDQCSSDGRCGETLESSHQSHHNAPADDRREA